MARPKTIPADHPQPQATPSRVPRPVATRLWPSAPGTATLRTASSSSRWNCKPDAEHQQDDADLGELVGQMPVGDEAGRRRPDHDPRQQVTDDRREPEPERDVAANQGRGQAAGQREDEVEIFHDPFCQGRSTSINPG